MKLSLTLECNEVMQCIGPLVDRLIEDEHELGGIWYAFAQYLENNLGNIDGHHLTLPYFEPVMEELNRDCLAESCDPKLIYDCFNLLYRKIHPSLMPLFQMVHDQSLTMEQVEAVWEEPLLHHHPVLVFKTADNTQMVVRGF